MARLILVASVLVSVISVPSFGALVLTQSDGATPAVYANGGGGGFGGTLGNGSIYMDVIGSNILIGFTPGNALNDIVALYLDTKSGGFLDAQMSDQADGGRTAISELTLTKNDDFPVGVVPDFGIAFGNNFGALLFELNGGSLNFIQGANVLQLTIPLATLSNPTQIDFFTGYTSPGGYNSNESLPRTTSGINQSGNPGFGDGQFGGLNTGGTYDNHNRFITGLTAIPEPGTFLIWGLVLVTAGYASKRVRQIA